MAAAMVYMGAGGIGAVIAQDGIQIDNHLARAEALSLEAIEHERDNYKRIKEHNVLIVEGDSWFKLPLHADIPEELEDLGYAIMSGAEPGDTLENMAFGGQLSEMAAQFRRLSEIADKPPKAILLSAGGNDIVGPNFEFLLNHSRSTEFGQGGDNRWQQEILDPALKRIQSYIIDYIAAISIMCKSLYSNDLEGTKDADCTNIPIVIHGYDYPVPSGNAYTLFGIVSVKGPWLRPSFQRKKQENENPETALIHFVDRHNECLIEAVDALNRSNAVSNPVCYLDLRGEVTNWSDELHPDKGAVEILAGKFRSTIDNFANKGRCPMLPAEATCRR